MVRMLAVCMGCLLLSSLSSISCGPTCLEGCFHPKITLLVRDNSATYHPEAQLTVNDVANDTSGGLGYSQWCAYHPSPPCTHAIFRLPGTEKYIDGGSYIAFAELPVDLTVALSGYASLSYSVVVHVDECRDTIPLYLEAVLWPTGASSELQDHGTLPYCSQ